MKHCKWIPFFVCLALFLTVAASASDTVSVALTLPDGTSSEQSVTCPTGAALWWVSYGDSGEMLEAGKVTAGVAALSHAPATVKAFALGDDCKPLSVATLKGGSAYQRGLDLLESGDYAAAVAAFTEAISAHDNAAFAHVKRGDALIQSGETAEHLASAKADYNAALSLNETLSGAYLGLADVAIRQADYAQAETILKDALKKTSDTDAISAKITEIQSGNIQDSAGKTRRRSTYNAAGVLLWRFEYAYDAQNRESSVTSYDASGTQTGRVDLRYDEAGRKLTDYASDTETGELTRKEYEYDALGNPIKRAYYSLDGQLWYYFISQYDKSGFLVRDERYGPEGTLDYYYVYQNNANGLWSKRTRYTSEGNIREYQTREYTSSGDVSVFCTFDAENNLTWRWVYDYDATGKRIRWTEYDGEGNVKRVTEYE